MDAEAEANGDGNDPAARDAKGEEEDAKEPNVVGAFFGGACGCTGVVVVSTGVAAVASVGLIFSAGGYAMISAFTPQRV